jgi:hypothetical protein
MFTPTFTLALTAIVLLTSSAAAAPAPAPGVLCAVCPSTIVFEGLTRTLTLIREEEGNTLQCK